MRCPCTNGCSVRTTASTSGSSGIGAWSDPEKVKTRLERQRMFPCLGFGSIAERRKNRPAFIPIGKLVGVVTAARLPRFARGNQQNGLVPVRGIGHEAHGRPVSLCRRTDAVNGARLRLSRNAENCLQKAFMP